MKFDDILRRLGEFGRYQKLLYFFLAFGDATNGTFMLTLVFYMFIPKHRCKIPGYPNDTYAVQNEVHRQLIAALIPPSVNKQESYDSCHLYSFQNDTVDNSSFPSNASLKSCTEWVYDKTVFYETFTSKENLVCGDTIKTSNAMMVFYFGVLVGDIVFGSFSDYVGRKRTFQVTSLLMVIVAFAVAWAPGFYSFCVLEFLLGASEHGFFMTCIVLGMELVGPLKRIYAGVLLHINFSIALTYLSGVGYLIRHWRYIQIVVAVPVILYFLYYKFVPESPRWLISKGKYKEAEDIIQKAARINRVDIPKNIIDENTITVTKTVGLWQLFTSYRLCIRTLIIFYNWFVCSLVFFGITMQIGNLGGDFYLNFFIQALVSIPASALPLLFLERIGRRKCLSICMLISGIGGLLTLVPVLLDAPGLRPLMISFAMLGKIGTAAAFPVIYTYSLELFPTVVRNGGMGASSCVSRLGSMVSPYITIAGKIMGGKIGLSFPLLIFGGFSIAAAFLTLLLPETTGKKLPDTIQEGKSLDVFHATADIEMTDSDGIEMLRKPANENDPSNSGNTTP